MGIQIRAAVFALIFGLCSASAGVALAEDAANPAQQLQNLKKYGAAYKTCDGWSDGCAICARRPDGTLGCSRLGVDCTISDIQCTQLARDPKTGKTPPPE